MLPPGHAAGGYLTAKALLKFLPYKFTVRQVHQLIGWGIFFGVIPDIDIIYSFLSDRTYQIEKVDHRRNITHAPVLWLIAGLIIYFSAASPFYKTFGLLVWLGTWSHFLLDSFEFGGVMWLWPLNTKRFGLLPDKHEQADKGKNFLEYLKNFFKYYSKHLIFYLEIILIIYAATTSYR